MGKTRWRSLGVALVLSGVISLSAFALPGFSDRNIAAGNLNPTDRILVQEVRVTGDTSKAVTIGSVTVQNQGTAGSGQIDKIEVYDGATALGETTNLAGLTTAGVTINLGGYTVPAGTTHYIKIYVTVGGAVSGGETVSLRVKFYYQMDSTSYTSAWISDLTGETIRKGGFDATSDTALDAAFFNPGDDSDVQVSVFTDNDANGNNVLWQQTGSYKILDVENLGTGTTADIFEIRVVLTIDGTDYVTWDGNEWLDWSPASPMLLRWDQFKGGLAHNVDLPVSIPDNSSMTVRVQMKMETATSVTDGRTIRPRATVFVKEGTPGNEVSYDQTVNSSTTQTIRKQGFEAIVDQSTHVASGTKTGGDYLEQVVKATDDDVNASKVKLLRLNVRNAGTAAGSELHSIKVMRGAQTLVEITGAAALANFKTGLTIDIPGANQPTVDDDGDLTLKIYYNVGTPVDGHTLQPVVKVQGREPDNGTTDYWSDEVTYPDSIVLYAPGFEIVENLTPPEGGTAYSGQRLLAQKIRLVDKDENDDNVTIHPVVVKNLGSAQENPDVVKIEVMRRNSTDGTDLPMGEATTLTGLRTSGVTISTLTNNTVTDAAAGAEVFLVIYVTIADPEQMVAGRTVQLETRILHTEAGVTYDKSVTSNQWTLAVNHRPVPDFTFAKMTTTAAVGPLADFTYEDTIQFTGAATDADGDAISAWHWDFDDGTTSDVQNPTHQFPNGGTFDVTLTVTDARGVTGSVTKTITVEGPPNVAPTVEITFTPAAPDVNEDVTFTATVTDPDQPTGTPFTYGWDFNDGGTSTAASPTHKFAEKKSYTVTVTVTDAENGQGTASKVVAVGNEPPTVATLTFTPANPTTGDEVTFTATVTDPDQPAGVAFVHDWDFNDGGTSAEASPVKHRFMTPGTYTVTLVVTDEKGSESAAKTVEVTVTGPTQLFTFSFPNPAATQATITYYAPDGTTDLVLRIYDLAGRLVREVDLPAGESTYVWDLRSDLGEDLPNGLYFCIITGKDAAGKGIKSPVFKLLIAR